MREFQRKVLDVCTEWVEEHGGELHAWYKRGRERSRCSLLLRYESSNNRSYSTTIYEHEETVSFGRIFRVKRDDFEKFMKERLGDKISFWG